MDLAALVLSVLALLAAGASAFYTKRQAEAVARTVTLDAERRYEERTPTFDAWIDPVYGGGWHRLWLRLTSREGLSAVQLAVTEREGFEFTTGQYGVELGAQPPVLRATKRGKAGAEGMAPDERTAWEVQFSQSRPPEIRLKITAVQEEFTWNVTVPVKTPTEPTVW